MSRVGAALALACLGAPLAARQADGGNGESWALFRGWAAARRVDFRVPFGPCLRAAEELAAELGAARAVSLDPQDRDPEAVRVLVGASWDAELLALVRPLGVEPMAGGFCVLGREFGAPGDALRAVFEDPLRPGRPLCVLLGNDLELLDAYLDQLPRLSRPELVVWADGDLALVCPLSQAGVPRAAEALDYLARRQRYFASGPSVEVGDVRVQLRHPPSYERWQAYSQALIRACKRTLEWFGVKSRKAPPVELYLYAHLEDMEECLGTSAPYVISRVATRAHVLFADDLPDDGAAAAARVLAREVAGRPAAEWLAEGQALAAAGTFFGRPLEQVIGHLHAGRCLPAPELLVSADARALQEELVLLAAWGFLFRVAASAAPPGAVRALWKGAPLDPRLTSMFEREAEKAGAGALAARGQGPRTRTATFLHGLALVESERVRYSSSWVEEALVEAAALEPRPDAVSLTVFAAAEDPAPPAAGARLRTAHGGDDLALASASAAAHAQGFAVALALEVLAQPNGTWADTLPWASPEDRWDYWRRYERVAFHYAVLAELIGAEVFSFGANLRTTPAGYFEGEEPTAEQVEQRAQSWKNLIARLRGVYTGGLTYGADPSVGAEPLFYEHLDYLGVLLFPPVPGGGVPDDELLRRTVRFAVQEALDLAVRWNKPLLLLQTGFPARGDSWADPLVPRGPEDPAAQARFLGVLAEVLTGKLENGDGLRGFFLWNWPIDPEVEGAGDRGYSLRGRALEPALDRLFGR